MRFLDIGSKAFRKELLVILPFNSKICGEDLFKIMIKWSVSLSTDGTSAMTGKEKLTSKENQRLECYVTI